MMISSGVFDASMACVNNSNSGQDGGSTGDDAINPTRGESSIRAVGPVNPEYHPL